MHACTRLVLVSLAVSAGLGLAGCDTVDRLTDTMQGLFDTKKKLPGERKPVFPEGVPGVTQGVPSEYLPAKKTPGEEASEPAAQDGDSRATDAPAERKGNRPRRNPPLLKPRPRQLRGRRRHPPGLSRAEPDFVARARSESS